MGIFKLFKTEGEKRAYAKGRRDQYNKEHPKLRYALATKTHQFNEDGSYYYKPKFIVPDGKINDVGLYRTKKEAVSICRKRTEDEKYRKIQVKAAAQKGKVNMYNGPSSYDDFKVVKLDKPVRRK